MDVEALLQAAADAGVMKEEGELPDHIRRLWSTYDTAINNPCLGPELRLLQVKNERRQAVQENSSTERNTNVQEPSHHRDSMDLDLGSVTDQTLITPFSTAQMSFPSSGPRSIYQVCRERQAEFHRTRNPA
jgi:hypothetical protein